MGGGKESKGRRARKEDEGGCKIIYRVSAGRETYEEGKGGGKGGGKT